jgi:hypothetical protein
MLDLFVAHMLCVPLPVVELIFSRPCFSGCLEFAIRVMSFACVALCCLFLVGVVSSEHQQQNTCREHQASISWQSSNMHTTILQ